MLRTGLVEKNGQHEASVIGLKICENRYFAEPRVDQAKHSSGSEDTVTICLKPGIYSRMCAMEMMSTGLKYRGVFTTRMTIWF